MLARRDVRGGPLHGAAAWLPRFYLYVGSFTGAMLTLFGASDLIATLLRVIVDRSPDLGDADWWMDPVTSSLSRIAVGGIVWAAHWSYSLRLVGAADWRASSEGNAALRRAYFFAVPLVVAVVVTFAVAGSFESVLRVVLGVDQMMDMMRLAEDVVGPLLAVIPFVAGWWLHRRRLLAEASRYGGQPPLASAERVLVLGGSLVGLAFAGSGSAWTLGLLIDLLLGGARTLGSSAGLWGREVSQFAALAAVGAVLWLANWYAAQRRQAANPEESSATARRAYLYLVISANLIATLTTLAFVVYRVLRAVLSVAPADISDISAQLGVLIVSAALLALHGAVLRSDLGARARATAPVAEAATPVSSSSPVPAQPEWIMPLVLSGPLDADFASILAQLRARLPTGYVLAISEPTEGEGGG